MYKYGTTGKKRFDAFNIQGRWNNKKARRANTHQGHRAIDLQLCVDLPMKACFCACSIYYGCSVFSNKVYSRNYNCTNTINQVTFKFIPRDFVQN